METKIAFITGITGQDGHYLTDFLLKKGYEIHGLTRKTVRDAKPDWEKFNDVIMHYGDVRDHNTVENIVMKIRPDEVYHLAAQSDVAYSFKYPDETYHINIDGTLHILNAILPLENVRMYFAGTSEMFGLPDTKPQNENTPMRPKSPYAVSKLAGFYTSKVYRESYKKFVSCGILFNHESPLRGPNFVTRKITLGIARYLKYGLPFSLGNIYSRKDWGFAGDYVEGMWMMLQHSEPDDFVLATNEQHTVKEILEEACRVANIKTKWVKKIINKDIVTEDLYDEESGKLIMSVDPQLFRPSESENYQGDYSKAKRILGWEPKTKFKDLVKIMMTEELNKNI